MSGWPKHNPQGEKYMGDSTTPMRGATDVIEELAKDAEYVLEALLDHNVRCLEAKLLPGKIRALKTLSVVACTVCGKTPPFEGGTRCHINWTRSTVTSNRVRQILQGYADSYKTMGRMKDGDGSVMAESVAYDFINNIIPQVLREVETPSATASRPPLTPLSKENWESRKPPSPAACAGWPDRADGLCDCTIACCAGQAVHPDRCRLANAADRT